MPELISMSEFARRKGVTPQSVCKAVKCGRIGVIHEKGKPKLDWEIASVQWDRSRRVRAESLQKDAEPPVIEAPETPEAEAAHILDDDEPVIPPGTIYAEQRGATEAYKAKLARLEYLEKKGQLVKAIDVKYAASKMVAAIKQRVQSVPSKAKIRLPHLSISDMSVLDDLMRETLTELSEWSLKNG